MVFIADFKFWVLWNFDPNFFKFDEFADQLICEYTQKVTNLGYQDVEYWNL